MFVDMTKCHTGMSMDNKACSDRIPNFLRIRDGQLSSVTKDQKHQKI